MNVMREFTKKSLLSNKKRTAVTIVGVIISAAMITAVSTFIASFLSTLQRTEIATGGNWHAKIQNVQTQKLSLIEQNKAIDSVVLAQEPGSALLLGSKIKQKPYLYFRNYSENGFSQMSVHLISGSLPQRSGEVILSETVKNSAGVSYNIGDILSVTLGRRQTLKGEAIAGNTSLNYQHSEDGTQSTIDEVLIPERAASFTVVGIMERPNFESSWSAGCGVLGIVDNAGLSATDSLDVYLNVKNIDRGIYQTLPSIAQQTGNTTKDISYNDHLLRYYGVVSQDNVFGFLFTFAAIIICIIVIASVSLIYNSFAISVSERAKQLGLLSSVGATRLQKRTSVYYEALFIGSIGVPLGILAGLAGIGVTLKAIQPLLMDTLNSAGGVTLSLVVSPLAIVFAAILSSLTIFISVYIPARRASKISPIDAIRQSNEIKLTRKAVKTSKLTRKLFGFEAEIALKNLKRSRKKYRATIVSLVISLVLFLTASTYIGMTQNLSGAMDMGFNYDISIQIPQGDTQLFNDTMESVSTMPHVLKYTASVQTSLPTQFKNDQLTDLAKHFLTPREDGNYDFPLSLIALDQKSFSAYAAAIGLDPSAFMDTNKPQAALINHGQQYLYVQADKTYVKQSGDILALKGGDTVSLYNQKNEPFANVGVGAVTHERPMGVLIQGLSHATMVMTQGVFDAVFAGTNAQDSQMIYLTTNDDQALEKQLSALPGADSGLFIYNIHSAARAERNLSLFLGVFIYGFIVLISLICIVNIFNTVSTNIALRRKEFAMLRSVGMTPKSFNKMIRFESIFYGLKGLLYGLPISVAIAYLLYRMQQRVLGSNFSLPYGSYAFAILMILVIVFATMLYSTKKIKKENILDALKEESL